jgi:hypothetical protein
MAVPVDLRGFVAMRSRSDGGWMIDHVERVHRERPGV